MNKSQEVLRKSNKISNKIDEKVLIPSVSSNRLGDYRNTEVDGYYFNAVGKKGNVTKLVARKKVRSENKHFDILGPVTSGSHKGEYLYLLLEKNNQKSDVYLQFGFFVTKDAKVSKSGSDYLINKQIKLVEVPDKFNKIEQLLKYAVDGESVENSLARAQKVSALDGGTLKKFKTIPKNPKGDKYSELAQNILGHMQGRANGSNKLSILLSGDPGSGKTSFINNFSSIVGLPLIVIEAPHIVEEHLINIPFVVYDKGQIKESGVTVIDDSNSKTKVDFAESALITKIKSLKKINDEQLKRTISKNKTLFPVYKNLERLIAVTRPRFSSILFLDEFYRSGSIRIQNALRNILNGRIGNDKIPPGTYVIYASNMNDGDSLDDIPANHEFFQIGINAPAKDDFFNYMKRKHGGETIEGSIEAEDGEEEKVEKEYDENGEEVYEESTNLNIQVFNQFYDDLIQSDLGHNDSKTDIRLSPRRLEQIITYISANTPVTDENHARLLYNFIRVNTRDYITGDQSDITEKLLTIVQKIISKTSGIEVPITEGISSSNWRLDIKNQLETRIKLGSARKNVATIEGLPGIAKTKFVKDIAKDFKMGLISISTETLSKDDVIGIPNVDDEGTTFSMPPLFNTIMKEYNSSNVEHEEGKIDISGKGGYTHILFFDELNRTSTPVFNAIRRLMLEGEFNEQYTLPGIPENKPKMLVIAAINPEDDAGSTTEFTSHVKDVLDIIPATPSFRQISSYILSKEETNKINSNLGIELTPIYFSILSNFLKNITTRENLNGDPVMEDQQRFFVDLGTGSTTYLSPRLIDSIISQAMSSAEMKLLYGIVPFDPSVSYTDEEYVHFIQVLKDTFILSLTSALTNALAKQQFPEENLNEIIESIKGLMETKNEEFSSIKNSINKGIKSISDLLESVNFDYEKLSTRELENYIDQFSFEEFSSDMSVAIDKIREKYQNLVERSDNIVRFSLRIVLLLEKIESNQYVDSFVKFVHSQLRSIGPNLDKSHLLEFNEMDGFIDNLLKWEILIDTHSSEDI